jgi:alpha-ribazole phosphatase
MPDLWCWRHPKAWGTAGRCIGRSDVPVDPRKAKRLAHRIRVAARAAALPKVVAVSPLRRCREVGRWLHRWGWRVRVDARLLELDFGAWDGQAWNDIAWAEVQAWQTDFLHHRPGGGEALIAIAQRAREFLADPGRPALAVGHGGWMNALRCVSADATFVDAAGWPAPPRHGSCQRLTG